jgi:hypothetical protein
VATLSAQGYLPPNFTSQNALGQTVRVYAALYPVLNPAGAVPPGSEDIYIPTAYVITDVDGNPSANELNSFAVIQGARASGVNAASPLIIGGVNQSDLCNGTPAVVTWDTGCLNNNDVNFITGGTVTVSSGQIIVPAWKSAEHDVRAIMRFPQPENPGSNVMATNLHFGTPTAIADNITNQLYYTPDQYDYDANTVIADNRRNILNVGSLNITTLVAADQSNDSVGIDLNPGNTGTAAGDGDDLIAGLSQDVNHQQAARINSLVVNGRMNVVNGGNGLGGSFQSTGGIINVNGVDDSNFDGNLDVTGTLSGNDLSSDTFSTNVLRSASLNATNGAVSTLNVTGEIVSDSVSGITGLTTVDNSQPTDVVGVLQTTTTSITGNVPSSSEALVAQKLNVTGAGNTTFNAMSIEKGLSNVGGTTVFNNLTVENCIGDCPETGPPIIVIPSP